MMLPRMVDVPSTTTWFVNPSARRAGASGIFRQSDYDDVRAFFGRRPDLGATPLRRLRALAQELGIAELLVKDESARFGLDAFKVAGVAYAVDRLTREIGAEHGLQGPGTTLITASTGNHGRAVAHVARLLGLRARVYLPAGTIASRARAIVVEGAHPVIVDGDYEAAVARAAADAAREGWTVVSDTAWAGYERIPRWIMAGYTWLMREASRQWAPGAPPSIVLVQAGVGGLACAVASWCAHHLGADRPFILVCEPRAAACLQASARAGRPVRLDGPLDTVMAGLRCAEPSPAAWPAIENAVDAFVAVSDERVIDAIRRLGRPAADDPPVTAGPSGACGLAGLVALATDPALAPLRTTAGLGHDSRVLLFNTEGATDPALAARLG